MKRDFSESSRQKLISLCEDVENEKWCDFTDKIGDGWYEFQEWLGNLSIEKYLDNVNAYHKKVIDKNNTTAEEIDIIFNRVNDVSTAYKLRFKAILDDLAAYNKVITQLGETVDPANGKFNSDYVGGDLDEAVKEYLNKQGVLGAIYAGGSDAEDVEDIDEETVATLLASYVSSYAESLESPSGSYTYIDDGMWVSPNVRVYYKQSVTQGSSDVNIKTELDKQQLIIKEASVSCDGDGFKLKFGSSGSISITSDSGKSVTINLLKGEFSGSGSFTDDEGRKITVKYSFNPLTGIITAEISITTTIDGTSVTTTAGIEIALYSVTMQSIDGVLYKVYVPSEYYTPLSLADSLTVIALTVGVVTAAVMGGMLLVSLPSIIGLTGAALTAAMSELAAYAASLGLTLSFVAA